MSDITDHYPSVRCIAAIRDRLAFYTAKDKSNKPRMLGGLRFEEGYEQKEEGVDRMPYVQMYDVLSEDAYAVTGAINGGPRSMPGVSEGYVCRLLICVQAEAGFVRKDPTDAKQKKGLIEWIALVKDAIETAEDGVSDPRLCGSLVKPVAFSLVRTDPTQASLSAFLDLSLLTPAFTRGSRTSV